MQKAVSPPEASEVVANGAQPTTVQVEWEEDTEQDSEVDTELSQDTDSMTPGGQPLSPSRTRITHSTEGAGGTAAVGASRQTSLPAPHLLESADPGETAVSTSSRVPASQDVSDEP